MDKMKVHVEGIGEVQVNQGSRLKDIAREAYKDEYRKYLGAKINNEVFNLNTFAREGESIEFFDISDEDGYRIYTKKIGRAHV